MTYEERQIMNVFFALLFIMDPLSSIHGVFFAESTLPGTDHCDIISRAI